MNDFTASNGIEISVVSNASGTYLLGRMPKFECIDQTHATGSTEGIQALREFFQAEADERLGRFRTDDVPEYVVYPRRGLDGAITHCFVVHETTGNGTAFKRGVRDEGDGYPYQRAARAYFDAHPETKPWHEAKPGEVWLLTLQSRNAGVAAVARDMGHIRFWEIADADGDPMTWGTRSADITAGRRIFPEVS